MNNFESKLIKVSEDFEDFPSATNTFYTIAGWSDKINSNGTIYVSLCGKEKFYLVKNDLNSYSWKKTNISTIEILIRFYSLYDVECTIKSFIENSISDQIFDHYDITKHNEIQCFKLSKTLYEYHV